jgi:hypothetical protein
MEKPFSKNSALVFKDWLIDYLLFYTLLKNLSFIWRRHHYRWSAAYLDPCSALRTFEKRGISFIVPHLLWHEASVFPVSSKWPPHSVASYTTQGDVENQFLPGSSQFPIQSPLTTHKGVWKTFSNPDPHGWWDIWNLYFLVVTYTLMCTLMRDFFLLESVIVIIYVFLQV